MSDNGQRSDTPALGGETRQKSCQQFRGLSDHCRGGQAVGEDHSEIESVLGMRDLLQRFTTGGIKAAAQVRAAEILGSVGGVGCQTQDVESERLQFGSETILVKRRVDGVASLSMCLAECQKFAGREAAAGSTEGDAGGGQLAERLPGVEGSPGHGQAPADWRSRCRGSSGHSRPAASKMPVCCSQVSNSGAGLRPRTWRR